MKEYKYTIDGKEYMVTIGEITDNVAQVTVNGEVFNVEMEPEQEPARYQLCLRGCGVIPDVNTNLRIIHRLNIVEAQVAG